MVDYERAKSLFILLRGLPPQDREARLRAECPDDPAMRAEVLSLLKQDVETFLATDTGALSAALDARMRTAAAQIAPDAATIDGSGDQAEATVAGRPLIRGYKILGELGRGGMGVVWRAEHLATGRTVALKLVAGAEHASVGAIERFKQEISLAAALEHQNIARVYDGDFERGVAYYTMELVDGLPLDRYVAQEKLSERAILELVRTLAGAVQFAHRHRVIHRDLKPSNVMVTTEGVPKLLDFGLAKISSAKDRPEGATARIRRSPAAQSVDGYAMGTPNYMPPEQARGRLSEIDTRVDIFALGAVLFELLTGQLPRDLKSGASEAIAQIAGNAPIHSPRSIQPGMSFDLESILIRAMASKPEDRYGTADEFAEDLTCYLTDRPVKARPSSALYVARKWAKRNWLAVAGVIVVVAWVSTYIYQINQARKDIAELLKKEEKQRQLADFNALRAEEQRHTALATIKDIVFGAQRNLSQNLAQEPIRLKLIEIANAGLRRIAAEANETRPEIDRTSAAVLAEVGDIFTQTGAVKDAQEAFEKAIERLEVMGRTVISHDSEAKRKRDLIVARIRLARLHLAAGRVDAAREQIPAARKLLEPAARDPIDLRHAWGLQVFLGDLEMEQGAPGNAVAQFESARVLVQSASGWPEGQTVQQRDLSLTLKRLASALLRRGAGDDFQSGLKLVQQALGLDRMLARDVDAPRAKMDQMSGFALLAELSLAAGDAGQARQAIDGVSILRDELASNAPDSLDLQKDLAAAAYILGQVEEREGNAAAARAAFDQCIGRLAVLEKEGKLAGRNVIELFWKRPGSAVSTST